MIERDLERHASAELDLVVVGGGVYGILVTWEAARRGLRVALIERDDFGGETSLNSLRILHGGLRYLQSLDLVRFRESVAERAWWIRSFPALVQPLSCLMPLYGEGLRRPAIFRVALKINDLLSHTRNDGIPEPLHLPAGGVVGAAEVLRRAPGIREQGLVGGALWFDAAAPETQRLLVELLHRANAHGALTWNRVEATGVDLDGKGRVVGLRATDRRSGKELRLATPVVVNCAGPSCRELATRFDDDAPELFHRSYAFNLWLDREAPAADALALAPPRPGSRTYFLHPWKGTLFAGTYHAAWGPGDPLDRVPDRLVEAMIADLNEAHPALELSTDEILRVTWGFLPAARPGSADLAKRPVLLRHAERGGPRGLYSVSGVKLTTARRVAETLLRRIGDAGEIQPGPVAQLHPSPPIRQWPDATEMERLIEDQPEAATAVVESIASEESALDADDVLLRRTGWADDRQRAQRLRCFVAEAFAERVERPG